MNNLILIKKDLTYIKSDLAKIKDISKKNFKKN